MSNKKNSVDIENMKIPPEIKEKIKQLQEKIGHFKDKLLKDYDKLIVGVSILPPPRKNPQEAKENPLEEKEEDKDNIHVLVLVDDINFKREQHKEKFDNIFEKIDKISLEIDKKIKVQSMTLFELRESCFDGKYEILNLIALSTPIYDPTDIIAAIRVSEVHKGMVLEKFEKYIVSYVAAGSLFRGEKSNDIDVYLIVDDTDVKRMSRYELKERLRSMIITMSYDAADIAYVKKSFHIQVYILTDFWESVKDANPVIFTFLRDGVPLFDRGVFMPWKLLLNMGRIKPSRESIELNMDMGEKLIDRAKKKLLGIAAEDVYYAVLNPSQAALMLYGLSPPTPKETIKLFEEVFVQKEKLIEPKYSKILENAVKLYKDVDHQKIKEITGKELDLYLLDADLFIKRIKKLFEQIEKKRFGESIKEVYGSCISVTRDVLSASGVKFNDSNMEKVLKEYLSKNSLNPKLFDMFKEIKRAKKDYELKKLSVEEAEKIKREARTYVRLMVEQLQRKKSFEFERAKITFRHGEKVGEALFLEKDVFITLDIKAKEKEIKSANYLEDGKISNVKDCSLDEMDSAISKSKPAKKLVINKTLLESLRHIAGHEIEVLY